MTQNLRIVGKTIDQNDSNTNGTFTVPPQSTSWTRNNNIAMVYINSYGGYYNWLTATAGVGTNSVPQGDIETSICAKGWKLPSLTDFQHLVDNYTYSTIQDPPASFSLADNPDHYCFSAPSVGFYWSSTALGTSDAYHLWIHSGSFYINADTGTCGDKENGWPVRCISEP